MDLELLTSRLHELGEPAYRERQVWRWAAQGAGGFAEMTDLPLDLRAALEETVPYSSLTLIQEAHSSDGTVKALFETAAEVISGLDKAFKHYEEKSEEAWR